LGAAAGENHATQQPGQVVLFCLTGQRLPFSIWGHKIVRWPVAAAEKTSATRSLSWEVVSVPVGCTFPFLEKSIFCSLLSLTDEQPDDQGFEGKY
jgi:hypothetical protein